MTCFSPLQGWKSKALTKNGKRQIVFNPKDALGTGPMFHMAVPCGQCVGCRLDYSREWAVRCMHEASLYDDNSFITLTYNDKYLPLYGSLNFDHWERFMKRFREFVIEPYCQPFRDVGYNKKDSLRLARPLSPKIRFYMGPEYGEKSHRPHYHALIFGYQFYDRELIGRSNGIPLWRSPSLDSLWSCPKTGEPYGYASFGEVTYESAAYVARYMLKKVKGDDHVLRYFARDSSNRLLVSDSGEIFPLSKESARMSNKPGIGKAWFDKYSSDVYPSDFVILSGGRKVRPPKYYDSIYQKIDASAYDAIKEQRMIDASKFSDNNTPDRLEVRRIVKEAKLNHLVRNLDV